MHDVKFHSTIKAALAALFSMLALGLWAASTGDIVLSSYWQDHMVLQRGKPITVWGKDVAGRAVTVAFAGQRKSGVTDADGLWVITFDQPFALSAAPQTLTISDAAGGVREITDILVGDVFLAAGQSNMDRRFADTTKQYYEPQAVKDFCRDDDGIRFIRIARSAENTSDGEQLFDLPPHKAVDDGHKYWGEGYDWSPATGDNRNYVSSVALNFARYIRDANAAKGQNIPIGIIHASSGGTAIRQWMSTSVLRANGYAIEPTDGWYWNNMIAPILRAKFRAVLWYQGCSDAGMTPGEYKGLMDVLVRDWRNRWGEDGDLPFYAVQIGTPGYNPNSGAAFPDNYPAPTESTGGSNYVRVREGQRLWDLSDTGTHGLAVILDHVRCMGSLDLHPADKNFVGRRLSLFARRDLYGEPGLLANGPVFSRAVREADGAVRITFRPGTAKGLTSGRLKMAGEIFLSRFVKMAGPVRGFALCGENGVWQDADATVEGETVVLRAAGIARPTRFHYGYWSLTRFNDMEFGQRLSLYNGEGLPLSPLPPMEIEDANTGAKAAEPVLLPASCLFSPATNVTLSCATTGVTIRYTLDGGEPTAASTAYTAPIPLSATTTVRARAFATGKEPSDIVSATYALGTPPEPVPDPLWSVCSYVPSAWTPLANNILAGRKGTTAGGLGWGTMSKDASNLTDGVVPVAADESKLVGFCDGASVSWTFGEPQTITTIRISTRRATGGDEATAHKYAGVHLQDIYVKRSGSTDWAPLNAALYEKSGAPVGTIEAVLADDGVGCLAESVTELKIVFLKGEVVWCNVAEIEASGYATAEGPVEPLPTVASPTFSPASCSFYPSANVTLSCATAGATIRYTLDGTTPTASSTVYAGAIALSATTTVKARAFAAEMNPSAIASATYTRSEPAPLVIGKAVARPSTNYNGSVVSATFTGEIPDGAAVSATIAVGGVDYAGTVDAQNGTFTFALPADAVTAGNSYAATLTLSVGGVDYTQDVHLAQGTLKIDEKADWIAESPAAFGATGVWSGEVAEAGEGGIAVSNALFTAATSSPANAVVTLSSTFRFVAAAAGDFNASALAGVKVVKVGAVNRYAFLTGAGVITNLEAVADVSRPVCVTVTVDTVAQTVGYSLGGTVFGPFPCVVGKDIVSKVRYSGATDVVSLDGAYRTENLDANLARVADAEYATVAAALAASGAETVELLWDASWTPSANGDYTIAPNGHSLAIGGVLAYAVTDNGDGTITVSVTGGGTPEAPVAAAVTIAGGAVKVTVANAQANLWYALGKTTDLAQPFVIAGDAQWASGASLLAGTSELVIALDEGETRAFYRIVASETGPTRK